jgi:hypothetical protein
VSGVSISRGIVQPFKNIKPRRLSQSSSGGANLARFWRRMLSNRDCDPVVAHFLPATPCNGPAVRACRQGALNGLIFARCYDFRREDSSVFRKLRSWLRGTMSSLAFPLPRKISPDITEQLRVAHVNAHCSGIWTAGRVGGRQDTFIGLINSEDWSFYLAPCFGVDPGVVDGGSKAVTANLIATGNFPGTTDVKSNSTSASDATMVTVKKSVLEAVYGAGNVCYAELDPVKGFDGQSHKSLYRWINVNKATLGVSGAVTWEKLLGFAIQRDNDSYYIRFASTLNEHPGQSGESPTFVKKEIEQQIFFLGCIPWGTKTVDASNPAREPRDLPKEWSRFVETVLARDLGLALISRHNIQSRGEGQFSRMTRFTNAGAEGDRTPLDTGIRLV